MGQYRANTLENVFAYVRFIHNVRVAQIFFGSLMCAEVPLEPSS